MSNNKLPDPSWSKTICFVEVNVFWPPKTWYARMEDGRVLLIYSKRGNFCIYWSREPTHDPADAYDGVLLYQHRQVRRPSKITTRYVLLRLKKLSFSFTWEKDYKFFEISSLIDEPCIWTPSISEVLEWMRKKIKSGSATTESDLGPHEEGFQQVMYSPYLIKMGKWEIMLHNVTDDGVGALLSFMEYETNSTVLNNELSISLSDFQSEAEFESFVRLLVCGVKQ